MLKYLLDRLVALSATALAIAFTRAFSIFLFVLSARAFTPDENGRFIQAVAIPQIVAQMGTLGWLPLIVKEVSGRPDVPTNRFKGFLVLANAIPLCFVSLVSIGIAAYGFATGNALFYALIGAFTLASTGALLIKEYMLSLKLPMLGTLLNEGFPFAFASALIWATRPTHIEPAMGFLIIGSLLSICVTLPFAWSQLSRYFRSCQAEYHTLDWLRSSIFSFLGNSGRSLLDRLDVITLSIFAMTSQLAVYNSSLRVANLLLLPAVVLLPVFSPHLSVAAQKGDGATLRRDMQLQALLISLSALPLAGVLLMYPDSIIGFVFGEDYRNVQSIMAFMIMAQLIFAFSLPWSNLALMRGRMRLYGIANLSAFVVGAACAIALLPLVGALAVAVGSMIANTLLALVFFGAELPELLGRGEG